MSLDIDGILSIWDNQKGGYLAQYEDFEVHLTMQAFLNQQAESENSGMQYLPPLPHPIENYESEGSLFVYVIGGGSVIAEYDDGILVHRVMMAVEDLKYDRLTPEAEGTLFGSSCVCSFYCKPSEHETWCPAFVAI